MLSIGFWKPAASPEYFSNPLELAVHRIADRSRARFRRRPHASDGLARLATHVEALLEGDPAHQRHLRAVRKRQHALRERVSPVGWRAYLELEEAEFDRWAYAIDRATRWAFVRGRREPGRRRRDNR